MATIDLMGFGEAMLRLSPAGARVIEQSQQLEMYPAGSELNVCAAAARLGLRTSYVSRLGDSPMGRFVANKAREQGVDTSHVQFGPERQGVYFFENANPPRPGMAYYDRENTGMAKVTPEHFAWDRLLPTTKLFLTSGITAALSDSAYATVQTALKTASLWGQTQTAFDINYRSKLWTNYEARRALEPLLEFVDILLLSGGDAAGIFGLPLDLDDDLPSEMARRFGLHTVCVIYRPKGGQMHWKVGCFSNGRTYYAQQDGPLQTVDRLGAGDSFAAGFLTGFLEQGPSFGTKLGCATMALKNTFHGDLNWATREQVDRLMSGSRSTLER